VPAVEMRGGASRFLTIQGAALATALRWLSAALVDHNAHCTDFRRPPFSEFFNNIRYKRPFANFRAQALTAAIRELIARRSDKLDRTA
jgi:hypothetical protein